MRWPETNLGKLVALLGGLLAVGVILPLAFVVFLGLTFSGFPLDSGTAMVPGPVNAWSVYSDVDAVAGGDERRAGVEYRCRLRAVARDAEHPRRYRCVVPGHGAGDLVYRVEIRTGSSCWRARGDAPPVDGCIAQPADVGLD